MLYCIRLDCSVTRPVRYFVLKENISVISVYSKNNRYYIVNSVYFKLLKNLFFKKLNTTSASIMPNTTVYPFCYNK